MSACHNKGMRNDQIEVILFDRSGRRDTAEAATPEDALYAARTLYDEGGSPGAGAKRQVGFYVDGKLVRMVTGRP